MNQNLSMVVILITNLSTIADNLIKSIQGMISGLNLLNKKLF